MHNKFLKIIVIIFGILLLAAIFPWLSQKFSSPKSENQKNLSVDLSGFTKESVSKIVIKKGEEQKILNYENDKWRIDGEKADEEKINQLFQDFSGLKIKEMVSQNEDNHVKFEVAKENGLQLTITQNGKDSTFFAGKIGAAAEDFYFRKEGVKSVYLVNGALRSKMAWEAASWKKAAETEEKK